MTQLKLLHRIEDMTNVSVIKKYKIQNKNKRAFMVRKSLFTKICTKIGIFSSRGYPIVDIDNNNNGTEQTEPRNIEF